MYNACMQTCYKIPMKFDFGKHIPLKVENCFFLFWAPVIKKNNRKHLPVMVDSSVDSLKTWEWISIPLVDTVAKSRSPFNFLTRVVFPALAHPITIPLPLYTEIFPRFILLTNLSLSGRLQWRISSGIFTVEIGMKSNCKDCKRSWKVKDTNLFFSKLRVSFFIPHVQTPIDQSK